MQPVVPRQRQQLHHRGGAATLEAVLIDDPTINLHAERAHQAHQHLHHRTLTPTAKAPLSTA
jgi:hypothetical protein